MNTDLIQFIKTTTGATEICGEESLQSLWSGYGEILRLQLQGGSVPSVVVKCIQTQPVAEHPRGWNTDTSHQRKLKSYQVEVEWYRRWAGECGSGPRVAHCYGVLSNQALTVIVLEDLDNSGFALRKSHLTLAQVQVCLRWLADFHGRFLQRSPVGLWSVGSYWHLATRPDEYRAMADGPLKSAADKIDDALNNAQYQTLVHGDAKVANFCFSAQADAVVAVDFQYVGGGCGIKDMAYLMGSCLTERECAQWQDQCLAVYFQQLRATVAAEQRAAEDIDMNALEDEWRCLYAVAWADFQRFLLGWMPSHKKVNAYSKDMTQRALEYLSGESGKK
ncbi:oxidoreductase family protein [Halioxenophilus aromaticivorans]|uniref:DUF1679 domain-containing protein n=1 Tax=Halioxenophilus aromaticivorans TaxID=1306992 RepID=A0AAV3U950_9ALTE